MKMVSLHIRSTVTISFSTRSYKKKIACPSSSQRPRVTIKCSSRVVEQPASLIQWLVDTQGAYPKQLKIERTFEGDDLGWGLVATEDIKPNEILLSVPLSVAITSEHAPSEDLWSIHMAYKIVQELQLSEKSSILPWLEALPAHVDLPWLYWTEEEILQLEEEETIAEVFKMQEILKKALEMYPESDMNDIAWALSLVHSRSFINDKAHVWVPGIDVCNHSLSPNARVECIYNPDNCQGSIATEEIAPVSSSKSPSPDTFNLIAEDQGIKSGQKITINYGKWPNDVFLLFFGFVDQHNPHDGVALFTDLFDLTTFHQRLVSKSEDGSSAYSIEQNILKIEQSLETSRNEFVRMVVTQNGIDRRLLTAADALLKNSSSLKGKDGIMPMSLPEFLTQRCQELISSMPTSLEDDEALYSKLIESDDPVGNIIEGNDFLTPILYRMTKKRALHAMLDSLNKQ